MTTKQKNSTTTLSTKIFLCKILRYLDRNVCYRVKTVNDENTLNCAILPGPGFHDHVEIIIFKGVCVIMFWNSVL